MIIRRREFGLLAATSLFITALPMPVFAESDDEVKVKDKGNGEHEIHISGRKHKSKPPTSDHIEENWNSIDFGSDAVAQDKWRKDFPQHGQASILIDDKGNWQISGSFPAQHMKYPSRVTVGFGLKSGGLGKVLAITKTFTVKNDGANFSKDGHDAIVGDLWKDIVSNGYEWKWAAHCRTEKPKEPPPPPPQEHQAPQQSSSGGGESTFSEVIDDIGSVLGSIFSIF